MNEEQLQTVFEENGGDLTDDQVATLIDGGDLDSQDQGDTNTDDAPTSEPGETDANATSDTQDKAGQAPEDVETGEVEQPGETPAASQENPEPVIQAKDGKYTIPYEELAEARETAKTLKGVVEQQGEIIKSLQGDNGREPEKTADTQEQEQPFDFVGKRKEMFDAYEDGDDDRVAEIEAEIADANDKRIAEHTKLAVAEALAAKDIESDRGIAVTSQDEILNRHPELNEDTNEYFAFIGRRDAALADGHSMSQALIIAEKAVYPDSETNPQPAGDTAGDGKFDVAGKVDEAIKNAEEKASAPGSLSDVPGSTAHVDETEAMRDMSPDNLMDKFAGKSQEQIEDLLARAL